MLADKTKIFSKLYQGIIKTVDPHVPKQYRPLWEHPAGPKTIFFWAPAAKWLLVLAGIGDMLRPIDMLSLKQCSTLFATGAIWARFSMVITPVNYNLLSVNLFVACTQLINLTRIGIFRMYGGKSAS